jgi:GAF domain-containing protein
MELDAERCSLFLVDTDGASSGDAGLSKGPVGRRRASSTSGFSNVTPVGHNAACQALKSGRTLNLQNAEIKRLNIEDSVNGTKTHSMLCTQLSGHEQKPVAVLQVFNKMGAPGFTAEDEEVIQDIAAVAGFILDSAMTLVLSERENQKNQALISVMKAVSQSKPEDDIEQFIVKLVGFAYKLVESDRITLYVVDDIKKELWSRVSLGGMLIRVPIGKGIAGTVAESGEALNIPDAYKDPMFNQEVDKKTGYYTQTILCIPILAGEEIVGVIQCINAKHGQFTKEDVERLHEFSVEVGLALKNIQNSTRMLTAGTEVQDMLTDMIDQKPAAKKEMKSRPRRRVSILWKSLRSASKMIGVMQVIDGDGASADADKRYAKPFNQWDYDVLQYSFEDLLPHVVAMLHEFDVIQQFGLSPLKLRSFIDSVRENYVHTNPYHNYYHGVAVMHIIYMLLQSSEAKDSLTLLDLFACLVGGLVHDVDHRGKNNAFEVAAWSELAIRYNNISVLENHHASTTFQLLMVQESNFIEGMAKEQQNELRSTLVGVVLATDMAHHNDHMKEVGEHKEKGFDENAVKDRQTLCNLIVHCADLSNPIAADFDVARKWALMVVEEFSEQVAEEARLGLPVTAFMSGLDTEHKVAKLQIGFYNYVCKPLWVALVGIYPELQGPCVDSLNANLAQWEKIVEETAPKPTLEESAAAAGKAASPSK